MRKSIVLDKQADTELDGPRRICSIRGSVLYEQWRHGRKRRLCTCLGKSDHIVIDRVQAAHASGHRTLDRIDSSLDETAAMLWKRLVICFS